YRYPYWSAMANTWINKKGIMIFTSLSFALFFLIVAILYYVLPGKFRWLWLLLSGLFFYMYSNPAYILVPLFIILITWNAGLKIEQAATPKKARQFYLLAIIANIGVLVFFKYTNFFTSTAFEFLNFSRQKILHSGEPLHNSLLINVIAPLGISYITFQAIGYLIEIKRGNHTAEKHLGHFSTFLLFFPKIVAGPVERAHNFLPQLKQTKVCSYDNVSMGLKLILWGLFKKLVIAERLSIYVSTVFGSAAHHSGISIMIAVIFYALQTYADFSGYTDMALGFAKVLGFDLTQNFNRPLLAKSITEFWRKWHISLSTWFADYFYTPIAIAKRDWGNLGVIYAFFVTFIVLGFWHGANWTFIIFGALQGLMLSVEFLTRKARKSFRKKLPVFLNNILGIGFTFFYFAFSLIFFRADSVTDALTIIKRIFSRGPLFLENPTIMLFSLAGIFFLVLVELKKEYFNGLFSLASNKNFLVRVCYYCLLLVIILAAGVFDGGEFIYFQF
ncbi:MAG: MBOAT family O-acyltransferase, partial [Ferruginibacter sp.]